MTRRPRVSVIVPVYNDSDALARLLAMLANAQLEIIVVDAGDATRSHLEALAQAAGARLIGSARGRGEQLATGIAHASGDYLWMLHADTVVSDACIRRIRGLSGIVWGRFDVSFEQAGLLRVVARLMNWRSARWGICTGDQGICVHRVLLERIGGFPRIPLMEDIELTRRLRRLQSPERWRETLVSSARKWRREGVVKTIVRMWLFRLAFWAGVSPDYLYQQYYGTRPS